MAKTKNGMKYLVNTFTQVSIFARNGIALPIFAPSGTRSALKASK